MLNLTLLYHQGTETITNGTLQDKISVIANCKAFLTSANQTRSNRIFIDSLFSFIYNILYIVNLKKDAPTHVRVDLAEQSIYIHRVHNVASLVTLCSKKGDKNGYYPLVARAHIMLNRGINGVHFGSFGEFGLICASCSFPIAVVLHVVNRRDYINILGTMRRFHCWIEWNGAMIHNIRRFQHQSL